MVVVLVKVCCDCLAVLFVDGGVGDVLGVVTVVLVVVLVV